MFGSLFSFFLFACSEVTPSQTLSDVESRPSREAASGTGVVEAGLPSDFPAEKDLAILFELFDAPVVSAGDVTPVGRTFLPYRWLYKVSEAFKQTDVGDALDEENFYEEWRVVSMRVVPCQPMGIMQSQDPDVLCWPTLRLVWQPVVENAQASWGTVDYYADDRAIHAIYPLKPRTVTGQIVDSNIPELVGNKVQQRATVSDISDRLLQEFSELRDSTTTYFLSQTEALRSDELPTGSWREHGTRPEIFMDDFEQTAFRVRIRDFMGEFALPNDLKELTAFSLPAGRSPAHSDIWVFLQFEGKEGEIHQRDLTVLSPDDGRELVNIGPSQTVSMAVEDPVVQAAIDAGNTELEDVVIIDPEDVEELGDAMADPDQFFVPNTSCASCHRLNNIRFDFHSLSHLEDGNMTISPRVVGDVERELWWVRSR